jgi:hypothetical protein
MHPGRRLSFHFAFLLFVLQFAANCSASIVISIFAGRLEDQFGAPVPAGTLIQLIDLGPNGVFDLVNVSDGSEAGPNLWVSGDDTLTNYSFVATNGAPGDFPTTAAFDLRHSDATESTNGVMSRLFDLTMPAGRKLGIRWWPQIKATDYATFSYPNPLGPPRYYYGQFTRQSNPQNGGITWISQADGGTETFDAFSTEELFGSDPSDASVAMNWIPNVPEPSSLALVVFGSSAFVVVRRRRKEL